jgi:CheY-like chemotaxis protein
MAANRPDRLRVKPNGRSNRVRPGSGKRVLIVNDTQEILELFQEILEELGFAVEIMSYAPRELEQVRAVDPDIVILDLIFGQRELEGWQLLQKLRMDRQFESLPVIVCSAAVREVAEQEGYLTEQGVLVVLKPFTVSQLEEAVRRAVLMADQRRAPVSAKDAARRRRSARVQRKRRSG